MNIWKINGGRALEGSVNVQGSKNAVLPIMAASFLAGCETALFNSPELSDVSAAASILRHLGCTTQREGDVINIDSRNPVCCDVPHELMREMRSSVIFLGAILGRCGEARLSMPGGCELGPRPIDIHLDALRTLGADITEHGGNIYCRTNGLKGAEINLALPSVGATENTIIAACAAQGRTIITNAAKEPEIVDLCIYLRRLGANITGDGTSTIKICGFDPVEHVEHRVMPDRIAAASLLCAVACAGGNVLIKGAKPKNLDTVISSVSDMGCHIESDSEDIHIISSGKLRAPRPVITKPYPGFPTDAQPLLMAACLKAAGTTVFVENIFENRFRHAAELRRLGADIRTEGRVAAVTGVKNLSGAHMSVTDLRGGAALIIAALSAEGESVIFDSGHVDRGYENLETQLSGLGADICRK